MRNFNPIEYLNTPRWQESQYGLERIELLLQKLGNPQNRFKSIHVAGTNGKGSVCSYIASILKAAGLKVGLFTSPYIECFEERIRFDGINIPYEDLTDITLEVRECATEVESELGEHPRAFELMCATAFVYFAEKKCSLAVVEVGLGGRLDATNVVIPELSVITRIGFDHTELLGDTLSLIAGEKAGIIKPGVPVVSWPQDPDAMEVIEKRCDKMGCSLTLPDFSELSICEDLDIYRSDEPLRRFSYRGAPYETRLLGSYQPFNAALAIEAARLIGFSQKDAQEGIAVAKWPGRFEIVRRDPLVIVDGSHNPQGAQALAESLKGMKDVTFVMGVLADKDYMHIVEPIIRFAKRFVVYTPNTPRALDAAELAIAIKALSPSMEVEVASSPTDAITLAVQKESPEGVVVAFGTLYAIGEIKQALR